MKVQRYIFRNTVICRKTFYVLVAQVGKVELCRIVAVLVLLGNWLSVVRHWLKLAFQVMGQIIDRCRATY